MKMKRLTAIVLSCALLMCVFMMPTSAASTVTLTVGTVSGQKGDIVELPVSISAESYMVNADIFINYDATRLELVKDYYDGESYKAGSVISSTRWIHVGSTKYTDMFYFVIASGNSMGLSGGGELFRLAFRILKDDQESIPVKVKADPICGNDGMAAPDASGYPADYNLACTYVAGAVNIGTATTEPPAEDKMMGDLTGDGTLNMRDALMLYQGVSGRLTLTDERRELADMTGDSTVNMRDALYLFSKVSGKLA